MNFHERQPSSDSGTTEHWELKLFRLLVENAEDYAIIMLDTAGHVASWNAGAERIMGYHAAEIVGQHLSKLYPPEARDRGWPDHELEMARTHGRFEDEGWRVRKDGSLFWVNTIVTALYDESGRLLGFSKITRDLTERKRAEETLRKRAAELEDLNRELAHKNREIETFVYSASHDLRSPLINLQGFSDELDAMCKDLRRILSHDPIPNDLRHNALQMIDQDVSESIHYIQSAVMRLSTIIDGLLRLSRAGRLDYQWQEVDVAAIVDRILGSLKGTILEIGATITVSRLPRVWGDPAAVEQVFANLLGNALKYLDSERRGQIEVGWDTKVVDSTHYKLYVKDNGLGISPEYQEKIFQPFKRFHTQVAKGEGMGLAIVRRVVERHGGRVWVESESDSGTTFCVTFLRPDAGAAALTRVSRLLQDDRHG